MSHLFESVVYTVSLVVHIIDDYTVGGPIGGVRVLIKDRNDEPIKNTGGYYVFTSLPDPGNDGYMVVIKSDYYFREEVKVDIGKINNLNPVIDVVLKPNSVYPFTSDTTLVRAVVVRQKGNVEVPLKRADVEVVMEGIIKSKIGEPAADSSLINLVEISGAIIPGDRLKIKDGDTSRQEVCKIAEVLPKNSYSQPFKLAENLSFNHPPGTVLAPVLNTKTSGNGEFVVCFRTIRLSEQVVESNKHEFSISLKVSLNGCSHFMEDVRVREGFLTNLNKIKVQF